ncbi:hypothetical protein [Nonomuraea recticatena]|uniref:Uncharacterized protein n=1 Tax=Nonomuraea recticatena TaxID=46178 RepID=A0ABN3TFH2_9ACTN
MTVTIPLVLLIGTTLFIAWRYLGMRAWHAVIAVLFGFLLAATTFAPEIWSAIRSALTWITGH